MESFCIYTKIENDLCITDFKEEEEAMNEEENDVNKGRGKGDSCHTKSSICMSNIMSSKPLP